MVMDEGDEDVQNDDQDEVEDEYEDGDQRLGLARLAVQHR